jgi:exonuclease SbcD
VRVGGIGDAPVSVFDGVDYVALGHLHGAQVIAADGPVVRYSGSPLAYSFSEEQHTKSVTLLDFQTSGEINVTLIPTPVPRAVVTLRDSLAQLLADPAYTSHEGDWVRAVLTDPRRLPDAMAKIRSRFPFALQLDYERTDQGAGRTLVDVSKTPPLEVASRFIEDVTETPATEAERGLLNDAIEEVRIQGVSR